MGAPVSAPVHTADPDSLIALTGPRAASWEGPQELMLPMSFESLGLTPELLRAVADQGYTEPTPVQREAIPLVLAGRDLLAGAQTGTGKTAAFVLPMLQLLNAARTPGWKAADNGAPDPRQTERERRDAAHPPVRALIMTPTRELCLQIEESVRGGRAGGAE